VSGRDALASRRDHLRGAGHAVIAAARRPPL